MGGSCTTRGCIFGNCGGRGRCCRRGFNEGTNFYGKCCPGPRDRINRLQAFGDCCDCHGCRSPNRLNVFDQYNLDFDQLFVGWNQNCPCRGDNFGACSGPCGFGLGRRRRFRQGRGF